MHQKKNLKRSRDSSAGTSTEQPLNKRTKIITDHEIIVISDSDSDSDSASNEKNTPKTPVHCPMDEGPDAEGFYHCIRLSWDLVQPARAASRALKAKTHPLPVKLEVLSPIPEDSLYQTQPNPECVGNNGGSSSKHESGAKKIYNPAAPAVTGKAPDLFIQLPDQTWVKLADIELNARWVMSEDDILIKLV